MHGRPLIPTMRLKIRYKYAPHKLDNTVAVVRGGGGGSGRCILACTATKGACTWSISHVFCAQRGFEANAKTPVS